MPVNNIANNIAASIGQKIRKLRKQRNMTLKELADQAGVSQSMLSQIERGIASPTIVSLVAIANALATSAAVFFEETGPLQDDQSPVYKSGSKKMLRTETGMTLLPLAAKTELKDTVIQLAEIFLDPGGYNRLKPTAHDGVERFSVLDGSFVVEMGAREYLLERGDSISINASLPHRLINPSPAMARGVWMIITPRAT